ncbi:MAG: GNAT family N-acetyltransferase [Candidatus Izemoplasmatales bacterium]
MNNQEIKNIVTKQLAFDLNCQLEDFFDKNKAVNNHAHKKRRYFYSDEHKFLHAININQNVIVACDSRIKPWIRNLIKTISGYRFFDSIQLNVINKELKKYHQQVGMIGEYFLPDVDKIIVGDINFRYEILKDKQILKLYKDKRFPMALMYKAEKKRKDNVAIVAYTKDNNIMGVAGSTLDSDIMCSIGIDVIDNHRNKGLGLALTNILTKALLDEGYIPYIGASIGNITSKNLAHKAGYYPFWIEMESYSINKSNTFLEEKFRI